MSGMFSQKSSSTTKRSRHKTKICAYDGKQEGSNYALHNKRHHGGQKKQWNKDQPEVPLLDTPWCQNWKEVIFKDAKPVGILPKFQHGAGAAHSKMHSEAQSVISQSLYNGCIGIENTAQEAIPGFRILGKKRSPQTVTSEVQQELLLDQQNPLVEAESKFGEKGLPSVIVQSLQTDIGGVQLIEKLPTIEKIEVNRDSLHLIPKASLAQKCQYLFQNDFVVPQPLPRVVYRNQDETGQYLIKRLKDLNASNDDMWVRTSEFFELASYLTHPTVSAFITVSKYKLLTVKDILLLVSKDIKGLSIQGIVGVAYAATLFGGSAWNSIPIMFTNLEPFILKEVLPLFQAQLHDQFKESLAEWICSNWMFIEEQTLQLL